MTTMKMRTLAPGLEVSELGLGCMGMSEFYGPRDDDVSMSVLNRAVNLGVTLFDTADIYGPHHNEELLGRFIRQNSASISIASKFGIVRQAGSYSRSINNTPEYAARSCEASLKRLGVETIDLYYVHRLDASLPVEEAMGGLVRLKDAGKIRHIGLCEVSAATLRRAHAVHPVAAVQTEYSLWTREVEGDILSTCRELGIGFVAYSPLGRGFLTGAYTSDTTFEDGDFRAMLPRFEKDNLTANLSIVEALKVLASEKAATPAQIALAWLLAQGDNIVPIPGTKRIKYLEENLAAADLTLSPEELSALSRAVSATAVSGERYTPEGMKGVNV